MINYKFRPEAYFEGEITTIRLVKLHYPESQWGEQISIFAHWIDRKIQFEAVDFYGNDYLLYPSTAEEPLMLEDLIYLLESMQLNKDTMEGNMDLSLSSIPEAESELYPDLQKYFDEKRKNFGLD